MKKTKFGYLKTGEEVIKYTLESNELEVGILNYGGIITDIFMKEDNKDKNQKLENLVLGYDNIKDYEEKSPHFGALTGRIAGRIANGEFTICGKEYKLVQNNGTNNLHGGEKGLDKRIWSVEELKLDESNGEGIEISYTSPHLEEGFPGEVIFKVRYTLVGGTLEINYSGEADRETIINLTNHSYFNLSGDCKEDILDHKMWIGSDEILELDSQSCPTGKKLKVENTPFDFRISKKIGKDIEDKNPQLVGGKGYDHPFLLENNKEKINATVIHEKSGRKLEVITDQKVIVVYTSNYLGEEHGKLSCGEMSRERLGVCLEAQDIPNHINLDNFESKIYSKEKKYTNTTKYRFSQIK